MSDKPTTGEQEEGEAAMRQNNMWQGGNRHKPTTGMDGGPCPTHGNLPCDKWTAEYVMHSLAMMDKISASVIADAHNAALAAERERYEALEKSVLDLSHPNFKMLQNDIMVRDNWLAAEREKSERYRLNALKLDGQLAEREKVRNLAKFCDELQGKVQTLVDALKAIRDNGKYPSESLSEIADAALAKIGKNERS